MVFDCMLQAYKLTGKVMPVEAVVKIDDTAAGMLCCNNAGCWTAFVSRCSRIRLLCAWIARPGLMDAAFNTFIIPCFGFLFLPFTTLMYVFLIQGVGKIQGLDWLWLLVAVLMDIASIGAAGATNRNYIPAGVPGSTQAPASGPSTTSSDQPK